MKIEMDDITVAIMVKSFYEMHKDIDPNFISMGVYLAIGRELSAMIDDWDDVGIPFVDWCCDILIIYPRDAIDDVMLAEMMNNQLFLEITGVVATGWLGEKVERNVSTHIFS